MASWLERLCKEIEHPTRSRREGARAALRCLSQVVRLRAAADRTSRPDAWIRVFDADHVRADHAADPDLEDRDTDRETIEVMHAVKRAILDERLPN